MNKNIFIIILFFLLSTNFSIILLGNGTAGSNASHESRYIVDMPTAGLLKRLNCAVSGQTIANGGFVFDATIPLFNILNVGISYGGDGILGSEHLVMQKIPGFHIKARVFNETKAAPAIVMGINTQGKERYLSSKRRFEQLSPGVYVAASKSFSWILGNIALHAGMNYSFEDSDNRGMNLYFGAEHTIYKYVTAVLEINPNLNDNDSSIWKNSKSLMVNTAIRVGIAENITAELQLKDLLKNSKYSKEFARLVGLDVILKF